jgi:small subunit ribosomal protein S14
MAKLALINRNEKRKKLVAKFAKKRDALQAIIDDPKATDEARPQPLRAVGASARRVPQVRTRPQQASRVRDARRGARHRQGQLVRG